MPEIDGVAPTLTAHVVVHPAKLVKVIVVIPGARPCAVVVATPIEGATVAANVLLLLQLPVVVSLREIVEPTHKTPGPDIGGNTFTDTRATAALLPHALETIYRIFCTPDEVPVNVVGSVVVLDNVPNGPLVKSNSNQFPPPGAPVSVLAPPIHMLSGPPVITGVGGTVFTVTTTELEQPVEDE